MRLRRNTSGWLQFWSVAQAIIVVCVQYYRQFGEDYLAQTIWCTTSAACTLTHMFQVDMIGYSRRYYSFDNKIMVVFSWFAHAVNQRFHVSWLFRTNHILSMQLHPAISVGAQCPRAGCPWAVWEEHCFVCMFRGAVGAVFNEDCFCAVQPNIIHDC